jgi:hypothetical protein
MQLGKKIGFDPAYAILLSPQAAQRTGSLNEIGFLPDAYNVLLDNERILTLERIGDLVSYDQSVLLGNLKSTPGQ